jgi:hypothetical protein
MRTVERILLVSGLALAAAAATALSADRLVDALLRFASSLKATPIRPEWPGVLRALLQDLLLAGMIVTGAALILRWRDTFTPLLEKRRFRLSVGIALTIAVQALSIWGRRGATVGGRTVWFLDDDAMISMRYGWNLAHGNGLVWNEGQRVEGYTNFLWTCAMALVHKAGVDIAHASLVMLACNVLLSCLLIVYLDRLLAALSVRAGCAMGALVVCALSREMLGWSLSGLEATALALLFTMAMGSVAGDAPFDRWMAYLAIALLPLVRGDAITLALLAAASAAVIRKDARLGVALGTVALAPFVAHLLFRHAYYGEWVPNTAYLKIGRWGGRFEHGALYTLSFVQTHAVAVGLAALAVVLGSRVARTVGVSIVMVLAYVCYIGGDAFAGARFFVPVLPVLFALAAHGLSVGFTRTSARRIALTALVVGTPLLFPSRSWPLPALFPAMEPSGSDVSNIRIGYWLRDHTPTDAVVGDYWAGSVFYFSGRRGVDFLGKMDVTIARMGAVCDAGPPGHNKFDFTHSLTDLRPDYVVAGFRLRADGTRIGPSGELMPDQDQSACRVFAALYLHPEFQARYHSNVAYNGEWRTVFQRR